MATFNADMRIDDSVQVALPLILISGADNHNSSETNDINQLESIQLREVRVNIAPLYSNMQS